MKMVCDNFIPLGKYLEPKYILTHPILSGPASFFTIVRLFLEETLEQPYKSLKGYLYDFYVTEIFSLNPRVLLDLILKFGLGEILKGTLDSRRVPKIPILSLAMTNVMIGMDWNFKKIIVNLLQPE